MTLPEEDVSIFELFVDWLYHQRYDIPSPPEKPSSDYDRYEQPVQLFVLADKYDVRNLKNRIISTMFLLNQQQVAPALDTVAYAYEHTPQNSTIRKLFAEYLRCTQAEWYQEASSQDWLRDHPEICTDIVVGYAKHREPGKFSYNEMPEEFIEKEEGSKE